MCEAAARIAPAAQALHGFTPEEVIGRDFSLLFPPQDVAAGTPRRLLERALSEDCAQEEGFRLHGDGSQFWARTVLTALRGPDGALRGFSCLLLDETASKQAREEVERRAAELARRNADLEQSALFVAHDLQAPLRTVEAFSRSLLEDYAAVLDEQGRDYLERLAEAAARLKKMMAEVLTLTSLGRRPQGLERVNVRRVVEEVIAANGWCGGEKETEVCVQGALPDVLADVPRVEQIFGNLISNGLKFNQSERPRVCIGLAELRNGWVTFYVRDNGIGIPPEQHERIFGVFQRLHPRDEYEGTGAGLAFVRRAVEALSGSVFVESEPGAGSTFYVRLPLWEGRSRLARRRSRQAA